MTRAIALALSLVALGPAAHAGSRPWTSDDVLAMKLVRDPQVSPDGRWVAYVVQGLSEDKSAYQTDVWLVTAAGGEARPLTTSSANDDTPRWSPDGRWLAFLSERPRPGAKEESEEGRRQVWLIRPDGGEPVVLTNAGGGVSALEWSPEGKAIGYLAREPKSEEQKAREREKDDAWTPSERYPWSRLWVLDVASREARQLTRGELHVSGFSFSPGGQRIPFARPPPPLLPHPFTSDLYVFPAGGDEPRPLVARLGSDADPAWSPDGKWIAFLSQDGKDRHWFTNRYVCVVSPDGGAPRNLGFDVDRLGDPEGLMWSPDSVSLVVASLRKTAAHLFRVAFDGRAEAMTTGPTVSTAPSLDGKGRLLLYPAGYQPGTRVPLALSVHG